jgi:hypothetical protein
MAAMSTSLLDLALSLLLSTASSIGQPSTSVQPNYLPATESAAQPVSEAAARRQARAARVSLTDPYYSFSRARRAASKD